MCKHQCRALIVKGHKAGCIVQQLGTCIGSQWEGLRPLEEQEQISNEAESGLVEDCQELDLPVITLAKPQQQVNVNDREKCVDKSRKVFQEMGRMASQSDNLAQTMQMKMNRTLHELKIQGKTHQVSGRRGLGRVELYHGGGKRTKQLLKSYLKRRQE
jgi:hypothetical protein